MIKQRSFITYILLNILTCGIYSIFFWYYWVKDINAVFKGDFKDSPNYIVVWLLSCITCGIYGIVWYYKMAERIASSGDRYHYDFGDLPTSVLLWLILGNLLCGIGTLVASYILIKNFNIVSACYNAENGMTSPQMSATHDESATKFGPVALLLLTVVLEFIGMMSIFFSYFFAGYFSFDVLLRNFVSYMFSFGGFDSLGIIIALAVSVGVLYCIYCSVKDKSVRYVLGIITACISGIASVFYIFYSIFGAFGGMNLIAKIANCLYYIGSYASVWGVTIAFGGLFQAFAPVALAAGLVWTTANIITSLVKANSESGSTSYREPSTTTFSTARAPIDPESIVRTAPVVEPIVTPVQTPQTEEPKNCETVQRGRFCANCGYPFKSDDENFCSKCGTKRS